MVRFGIVGVGNMGSGHAKSLLEGMVPEAALTAVCDINPKKLEPYKDKVAVFETAEDMYKSGLIDAVIIAAPHYHHPPLAILAFSYKLHVMSEKPAGVYTKQVREMNKAAQKSGCAFGMMFNQRTNCVYRKMKEIVESGQLGEIKRTNWVITNWYRPQKYYDSGDWRATWAGEGGGVLLNQCPHNLDLWQWICGMPSKVTAFLHEGKWHDIEVEDDVTAYVEYENGATGVFVTSTADAPGTNRFEITGDLGKLVCEDDRLTFYRLSVSEREFNKTNEIPFGSPNFEAIQVETDGENPQHNGVLAAMVRKILHGGQLVAKGEEGINGLTISNAMHLSSWLKQTITLPLDEDKFFEELSKRIKTSKLKKTSSDFVADLSGTY